MKPQRETCLSLLLMLAAVVAFVIVAMGDAIWRWLKGRKNEEALESLSAKKSDSRASR